MSKLTIYREILEERKRQDKEWGVNHHSPVIWSGILSEESGEVSKGALEAYFDNYASTGDWSNYREELVQAAAVAIAAIESLDATWSKPIVSQGDDQFV